MMRFARLGSHRAPLTRLEMAPGSATIDWTRMDRWTSPQDAQYETAMAKG